MQMSQVYDYQQMIRFPLQYNYLLVSKKDMAEGHIFNFVDLRCVCIINCPKYLFPILPNTEPLIETE